MPLRTALARPIVALFPSPSSSATSSSFSILLLLALSSLVPLVVSAQNTITLTYLDETGTALGQPQTLPLTTCRAIDTTSFQNDAALGSYSSVSASDQQAALNLYGDTFCQVLLSSTVGQWNNVAPVTNILGIRWEGEAPDSTSPGTLSPNAWPPGMAIQTKAPSAHDGSGDRFVMDPAKGRIVVGLVSAVLAIGVIIGVCQVYSAAQYVPPPPKPKPKNAVGKVGGKKIKKKDAYFKKPVRDERSSMLLGSEAGVGGNDRGSGVELDMMETNASRSRFVGPAMRDQNRFSVVSSTSQQSRQGLLQTDAVLIDMHDYQPPPQSGHPWNNTISDSGPSAGPSSMSSAANLIQFGNHTHLERLSQTSKSPSSSTSASPGRGGEVHVPMQQLGRRQSPTWRTDSSP